MLLRCSVFVVSLVLFVYGFFIHVGALLRYFIYRNRYSLPAKFKFNGYNIYFYGSGQIKCGINSYIGDYSWVQSYDHCEVVIGNKCAISHMVAIYTANKIANQDMLLDDLMIKSGNVVIGDGCWIGAKVSIIGPVVIGCNTVVGANSLVNRDLPPHSIAIGVPAVVVRFKSYLSKEEELNLALQYKDVLSQKLKETLF